MKANIFHIDKREVHIFMEDGGHATIHHNGEHMLTTYYQSRLENYDITNQTKEYIDSLDFTPCEEGKAYLHDWEEQDEITQEMIEDAVNWLNPHEVHLLNHLYWYIQLREFEKWKMMHSFMHDEPIKKWVNQYNFTNPFEDSWDALMPLVKKCANILGSFDYEDERRQKAEDIFYMDNMFSEFLDNDLNCIVLRCVEFIEWYNENAKR